MRRAYYFFSFPRFASKAGSGKFGVCQGVAKLRDSLFVLICANGQGLKGNDRI